MSNDKALFNMVKAQHILTDIVTLMTAGSLQTKYAFKVGDYTVCRRHDLGKHVYDVTMRRNTTPSMERITSVVGYIFHNGNMYRTVPYYVICDDLVYVNDTLPNEVSQTNEKLVECYAKLEDAVKKYVKDIDGTKYLADTGSGPDAIADEPSSDKSETIFISMVVPADWYMYYKEKDEESIFELSQTIGEFFQKNEHSLEFLKKTDAGEMHQVFKCRKYIDANIRYTVEVHKDFVRIRTSFERDDIKNKCEIFAYLNNFNEELRLFLTEKA